MIFGPPCVSDPRSFIPHCTNSVTQIAAWQAACLAAERGEYKGGSPKILPLTVSNATGKTAFKGSYSLWGIGFNYFDAAWEDVRDHGYWGDDEAVTYCRECGHPSSGHTPHGKNVGYVGCSFDRGRCRCLRMRDEA